MDVLFLIGNGFDLNVGLKTRFKDVLEAYLKRKDSDPRLCKFKEDINRDFENWSDFEKQMGIYTEEFSPETIDDYCSCIRDFREFLVAHLNKEESRINYETLQTQIISVFRDSIQKFYNGLQPSDKQVFRSITNNEFIRYNFMTFNYTDVLDKCLKILQDKVMLSRGNNVMDGIETILHIHGTIEEDLIMGVDNVSQITNENIAIDKKLQRTIIKPVINEKLKNLNNQTGQALISQSHIICVFGLSLGETDRQWWIKIGEWIKGHEQCRLVLFAKEEEWNIVHPEDRIEKIEKVLDKAFIAMNISQTESISDRIHIGFNTNMFKIDLTKKEGEASILTTIPIESMQNQN